MTDYKRLTRGDGGIYTTNCINCPTKRTWCSADQCERTLLDYFGKLEDKIESGELREVPRGAVILTPEERDEEMKEAREERVKFERRIELLNNELNRELFEHKAFIEKTAIEVGRLKAEKERAVKEFAGKLKEKALSHCKIINCYELTFIEETINELSKEYEK